MLIAYSLGSKNGSSVLPKELSRVPLMDRSSFNNRFIFNLHLYQVSYPISSVITTFQDLANSISFWKILIVLEILTKSYRNACLEGEAIIYRAHVAVLGDSCAITNNFIKGLLADPRYLYKRYATKGVKTRTITSKFNKDTKKTERWRESVSHSSNMIRYIRNAVLSHVHSVQQDNQAKGEMGTLQQEKISCVNTSESNKTGKHSVRRNIADKLQAHEKEFAAQFQNPDNKTLFFLHRNAQIKQTPDNNIPYSINLWEFDSRDEFSAVNHSFLKTTALILYVMDISLDLFSPRKRNWGERNTNENSEKQQQNF